MSTKKAKRPNTRRRKALPAPAAEKLLRVVDRIRLRHEDNEGNSKADFKRTVVSVDRALSEFDGNGTITPIETRARALAFLLAKMLIDYRQDMGSAVERLASFWEQLTAFREAQFEADCARLRRKQRPVPYGERLH